MTAIVYFPEILGNTSRKYYSGEWLIPEENPKTGKPHIVYLSTQVAAI
jgi:hypothetical protein